jgi:hypothetical protein
MKAFFRFFEKSYSSATIHHVIMGISKCRLAGRCTWFPLAQRIVNREVGRRSALAERPVLG